ncbi:MULTISPECIES: DNA repair protein RecN [unclassified Nocardioides]|uniref:DNA repair protein RecN n=1 Tax=unclassified Nocardioides TaxID=2615069 RepID=UPI00070274B5|nr:MULTISPECIES: DNA repair protein RecN [unclassified Nocardioides]KRC50334.1 DNA repair protein RecN [Nocardioides sp. Root79]KRC75802.1 DNA repair protein RecN [Nocardioides sp. Root240]
MIEELRISSLGVIDASVLELGPGLTVITGETGAGKTMVVTALGLLLGGRADSGAVRAGAKQARVEGLIAATAVPGLAAAVEEAGGEVEDDGIVLARNVSAEGRSRAFAGGASVPVATLAEIAEPLVAVHGQSDQHRLLKPQTQRHALDRFGALEDLHASYAALHDQLVSTEQELAEVTATARERAREADVLRYGVDEVAAVAPQPGEDAELASEEARLGHADTLRGAAEQAREALSSEHGSPDALGAVAAARGLLEGVRDHDPQAAALADRVAEVSYLLSDVAADVASYASGVDTDPSRLAAVSERRAALTALTRKYGETVDEVLAWAETASTRLLDLDSTDERIQELAAWATRLREQLAEAGVALSQARVAAAEKLSGAVSDELTLLAMPHARVTIRVSPREVDPPADPGHPPADVLRVGERWVRFGRSGLDDVEFLLAANSGSEPRPLHKGASGGELSRVMLAVEVCLAGTSPVPTFVFDEVDSGVGGAAAVEIGRRLATLADDAQVLVVTHLPQVAAFADRHVLVEKSSDGTVTTSGLVTLDDAGRERELSRMLAGLAESDTALAHARELLDLARRRTA